LRILIITQYFYPENFRINDVCLGLKERGHEVVVLTGKPNYPNGKYFNGYGWFIKSKENWNDIKIYRSNLFLRGNGIGIRLMLNYFSFAFFASLKVFTIKGQFDKIFIFAPSPITVGIPGIFARKKFNAKTFLWIHDLWPESIKIAGGIDKKWVLKIVDNLTRYIYSKMDKLLIQSKGFISYLEGQNVNPNKIIYYPFYAETFYKIEKPETSYLKKLPNGFKLLFAGNIGEGQSFETLLSAAKIIKNKKIPITWIVFGEGRLKEFVLNEISKNNLSDSFILMGSLPPVEMPKYFACVDALLVSLKKSNIFSITIPGKLQSYLACGRPIIGSLDGVGAEIINEAKAGYTSSAESADELANQIIKIYNTPNEIRNQMGVNARNYFEAEFEREILLDKLEYLLKEK
jgi:glycosyltransferase involved in cell wall biosynthesis